MLFSVIIPTYQRPLMLAQCLQRLMPELQTMDAVNYEVIVTDDGSDEATADLVKAAFPWVRYTNGPRRGPAANRNHGASLASGHWLVFTDDDCLPDAQWLQAYSDAITAHPECQAFEGAILPDDWRRLKKDLAECPVNTEGGCFWSANIMVAKSLFAGIGGFDEQFLIAAQEDQDLQWRIQQQHSIVFVPAAKVVHPVRMVQFSQKLARIPGTIHNWWGLIRKQKTIGHALYEGYKSQLRAGGVNLVQMKWRAFSLNLITTILLLPVLLLKSRIR